MATQKYLFTIDLDGTLLKNSATQEISKKDIAAVKKLRDAGHIVSIVTGRPWRSSKKAYESLGLDTVIGNYNGAQIHNPTDYNFTQNISYMNLNDVMYILGDKRIKDSMSNLAIEGPGWVMLQHRDKDLERVFGFSDAAKLRVGIDYHKLPLRPTGVVFDTKPGIDVLRLKDYLSRTYGDLAEFSSWSKGEGLTPVFDITSLGVTKARALALIARYYNIPMNRTVAIGDGYNDVPMFKAAEISVSVANSTDDIQVRTTYTTKSSNKENAVAEFVDKFLADKDGSFKRELKAKRRTIARLKAKTTKAH